MSHTRPASNITAIILTKDEEAMITNCIEALQWCQEILVVDSGSTDRTVELAESLGASVHTTQSSSFAERRTQPLASVTTEWVFYIDADERVTPQLAKEILVHTETTQANSLAIPRQNMMYGVFFHHGGWQDEVMQRVFRTRALVGWKGDVHESPIIEGEVLRLHSRLFHLTHRSTLDGLRKSVAWTPIEAKLLHAANAPKVRLFTLFRKPCMELFRRVVLWRGGKDGVVGIIEAVIQAINVFFVYVQLWELQQHPPIEEKYRQKEIEFMKLWKKTTADELRPHNT